MNILHHITPILKDFKTRTGETSVALAGTASNPWKPRFTVSCGAGPSAEFLIASELLNFSFYLSLWNGSVRIFQNSYPLSEFDSAASCLLNVAESIFGRPEIVNKCNDSDLVSASLIVIILIYSAWFNRISSVSFWIPNGDRRVM